MIEQSVPHYFGIFSGGTAPELEGFVDDPERWRDEVERIVREGGCNFHGTWWGVGNNNAYVLLDGQQLPAAAVMRRLRVREKYEMTDAGERRQVLDLERDPPAAS